MSGPFRQSWWKNVVFLTAADAINDSIWTDSPKIHARHGFRPRDLSRPGRCGAQQVMIDPRVTPGVRRTTVLPWVPDLLGSDWTNPCAMLMVGQSYAGFLDHYSNRSNRMPVHQYQNAGDWQTFQQDYVPAVVEDDLQYYEKLSPLLQITGSYSRFAVFDIVRASLVERRAVAMIGGCQQRRDGALDLRNPSQKSVFRAYASLPESRRWTWDRVTGSQASLIVALGRTAACQLIHLFLLNGCVVHERNSGRPWN